MSHRFDTNLSNYTRIFILSGKNISDEELRLSFQDFGTITDFKYLKDRNGTPKGITYITYCKPSEAARAIEEMNGMMLTGSDRPIKVILASNKSEVNVRDPEEDLKMRRLFIVVPNEFEDALEDYFSQFGEIVTIKKLPPNKGKTLGFITFKSSYCAARALEECSPEFKAVFAQTRTQQMGKEKDRIPHDSDRSSQNHNFHREIDNLAHVNSTHMMKRRHDFDPNQEAVLYATLIPKLDERMVNNLFNLAPGLISCHYNAVNGEAVLKYTSEEEGAFVVQRFSNFQYPPNCPISIYSKHSNNRNIPNIQHLVHTIEKATSLLQQAGLMSHNVAINNSMEYGFDLPPRQPVLPENTPLAERLFIVTSPGQLALDVLEDLFCRFGNLLTYNYITNKTYGYVRYANSESAHAAIRALHKKTVMGVYLKVILADPPNKEEYAGKRKNESSPDDMGYKYSKFE